MATNDLVLPMWVNSPVLGAARESSAGPVRVQPDSSIQDGTRVLRGEEHGKGGRDRGCISHWKQSPPCPADLLEPLHQPGGQSWWDVEQKSLLLQLP